MADFITEWRIDFLGQPITIPTYLGQPYNYTVNWGGLEPPDPTIYNGDAFHTYNAVLPSYPATVTITISGLFSGIYFNNTGSNNYITGISQWGTNTWNRMDNAFAGCISLANYTASDFPIFGPLVSLDQTFFSALNFNGNISGWNTTNVTSMRNTFSNTQIFNNNIGGWDVSNVTDMYGMFGGATNFNQDLSSWQTGMVTDMGFMFFGASNFNGGLAPGVPSNLNLWNVSNVKYMNSMFESASSFNGVIVSWTTNSLEIMTNMFRNAMMFNQDISGWNTSNVYNMKGVFYNANIFDQNLNSWVTNGVTDMQEMFGNAFNFTGNISSWNTGMVTDMARMFLGVGGFNQDLSGWNVSMVTDMSQMFAAASIFNQDISGWNVSMVTDMSYMFSSTSAFNQNISGWNPTSAINMTGMFYAATAFNQNLYTWRPSVITNIPTEPTDFQAGANMTWVANPAWIPWYIIVAPTPPSGALTWKYSIQSCYSDFGNDFSQLLTNINSADDILAIQDRILDIIEQILRFSLGYTYSLPSGPHPLLFYDYSGLTTPTYDDFVNYLETGSGGFTSAQIKPLASSKIYSIFVNFIKNFYSTSSKSLDKELCFCNGKIKIIASPEDGDTCV